MAIYSPEIDAILANNDYKLISHMKPFLLEKHGIPRLDELYFGESSQDYKRKFIKIPLDDFKPCFELRKHLAAIDKWAKSAMHKKLFWEKLNKYTYAPSIGLSAKNISKKLLGKKQKTYIRISSKKHSLATNKWTRSEKMCKNKRFI